MTIQYPQIAFKPGGPLYTFVNNEEHDLQIGDEVTFNTKWGGTMTRTVESFASAAPSGFDPTPCFKA